MSTKLFQCMFCKKESTNEVYLFPHKQKIGRKVNLCTECQKRLIAESKTKGENNGKL